MKTKAHLPRLIRRGINAVWALQELGPHQVLAYVAYKMSLRLGFVRRRVRRTMLSASRSPGSFAQNLLVLPESRALQARLGSEGLKLLLNEADEICAGWVRLFGGKPVPLQLEIPGETRSWIYYEGTTWLKDIGDIKFAWEPARFGWAVTLARAYHVSADSRYADAFWNWTDKFFASNPPGIGPQWASAQEVSIRLICLVFAWQVFAKAPGSSPERAATLARLIASHAGRIPPTLSYARAQNNNHLLSEAAGLYTAALALPHHAQAKRWKELGWQLFNQGLVNQIDQEGVYSQHSTNYHRLMLQLALWCKALADHRGENFTPEANQRLKAATLWLAALLDPISGQVPNLGPNDGAYIFPLSNCGFHDYRPVMQAAGIAFAGNCLCEPGEWDEMAMWFGLNPGLSEDCCSKPKQTRIISRAILSGADGSSWAYLRAAHYSGRPGHADQLHLDLWHNGHNIALDAGTYLYNAPPPWDNRLEEAFVHNTVTLDGKDQMQRAGRFLYLRRAQAEITEYLSQPRQDWERLVARHTGYRRLGMLHVRQVERSRQSWLVHDQIIPNRGQNGLSTTARLHWLLPDWPWELEENLTGILLHLNSPGGLINIQLSASASQVTYLLVRAGEQLVGNGETRAIWGWVSPTYGVKLPALSFSLTAKGILPLEFNTAWDLEEN